LLETFENFPVFDLALGERLAKILDHLRGRLVGPFGVWDTQIKERHRARENDSVS